MGSRSITSGMPSVQQSALPAQPKAQSPSDEYHVMEVEEFQKLNMSQPTKHTAPVHDPSPADPTQPLISQENESDLPGSHDSVNFAQESASYSGSAVSGLEQTNKPDCDDDKSIGVLLPSRDGVDATKDDSQKLLEKSS